MQDPLKTSTKPGFLCRASTKRRLDEADVIRIRERYAREETARNIAPDFGISSTTVFNIAIGRIYKDYGGPLADPKRGPHHPPFSPVDEEIIIALRCEGRSVRDIAAYFGRVNVQPIYRVLRKRGKKMREILRANGIKLPAVGAYSGEGRGRRK